MKIHEKYGLTEVINAAGTFTPLGVSRSTSMVGHSVAEALGSFFIIEELLDTANTAIANWAGTQAGTVTHCTASGITLAIAATLTGSDAQKIAALPDTGDRPNRVILPAGHNINYGQSILQAIRLAGATPVLAGTSEQCSSEDLETHLADPRTTCLLLVSSRLVTGDPIDLSAAIRTSHKHNVPAIVDCAAQDIRLPELLDTGADLFLVSAQKYLAAPTAGLVMGKASLVEAVRAQSKGIGRGMKASKESICGVLTALEERQNIDLENWHIEQISKVDHFVNRANQITGLSAKKTDGLPVTRICLTVEHPRSKIDAIALVTSLKNQTPSIRVMEYALPEGKIFLELVPLHTKEIEHILSSLSEIMTRSSK